MNLPEPVAWLLRPEAYPRRPPAVQLLQTHISWVFLAGDEVYKVRKPVHFSFLDFSSPARRRHDCREEVRLNRRLAPDVYRRVVAICREGASYRLGSEDDPAAVEYAVVMRRLADESLLATLLREGRVPPAMIDRIVQRLAAFHRAADSGPAVTANGDPKAIGRILADNFAGVRPFRGRTISGFDDDAIQAFARDFLAHHEPLLRRRQHQQRIRDGHGDLHCEHICFEGDTVLIIDCIEFNTQLRYCDVASEIAFLAMDLEFRGRADLAQHLISRYADETADPELIRLMPFYSCYRAYVRGKVASLKSVEAEVPPAEQASAHADAVAHFALAYRYTWAAWPALVVMCGLSGTGKSSLAAALAARTGFAHVSSDVLRKQLAGLPPDVPSDPATRDRLYTPEMSARTYAALLQQGGERLAAGRGVILDATFQRRVDRDAVRQLAAAHHVPVMLVECRCASRVVRARLTQRVDAAAGPSDADWRVYQAQRRRFEPFAGAERAQHVVIDTTEGTAGGVQTVERALRKRVTPTRGV
jgi:hypothetical protein